MFWNIRTENGALAGRPRRKNKDRTGNRFAIITVTAVVVSMALVVNLKVNSLKATEAQYREREAALIAQVAEQEERAETLEEYRVYVQTKQYIEKIAKEKLGLVNPDEIILKPSE